MNIAFPLRLPLVLDVFTLCFSEKLPVAGNLALYSEGNDIKWNGQGLTTVYGGKNYYFLKKKMKVR